MAELLEALCCICDARCIGSCLSVCGQCISGIGSSGIACISKINCDCCCLLCSPCIKCDPTLCCKVFESGCCNSLSDRCLSIFSFSKEIVHFSHWLQNCCSAYSTLWANRFACCFRCFPTNCLLSIGYLPPNDPRNSQARKHNKVREVSSLKVFNQDDEESSTKDQKSNIKYPEKDSNILEESNIQ